MEQRTILPQKAITPMQAYHAVVRSFLNPARNDDVPYHSEIDEKGS